MKVLMIGHSGAGKTSFMAGLYKSLGEGAKGYGMHAVNESQHLQLKRLADDLTRGQYPVGTDVQSSYLFEFTRNGDAIMPIEWIDYRGGALTAVGQDNDDLNQLSEQIADSDALIIFLDGSKLQHMTFNTSFEFDIILSCVELALKKKREHKFPVSLVITKADLITVADEELEGLRYFDNFLTNAEYSEAVKVSVTRCIVNQDQCNSTVFPFLFAMNGILPNYIEDCKKEKDELWQAFKKQQPSNLLMAIVAFYEQIFEWYLILVSFLLKLILKILIGRDMKLWSWNTLFKKKTRCYKAWRRVKKKQQESEKQLKKINKNTQKNITKYNIRIYGK